MKRTLSLLLIIAIMSAFFSMGVAAEDGSGSCGDKATWQLTGAPLSISDEGVCTAVHCNETGMTVSIAKLSAGTVAGFTDVSSDAIYAEAVSWAVSE